MSNEKTVEQKAEDRVNAALRAIRRVGDLSRGKNALPAELADEAFQSLAHECAVQAERFVIQGAFRFGQGEKNDDDGTTEKPSL